MSAHLCSLLVVAVRSITVSFWLGEHGLPEPIKEVTQAHLLCWLGNILGGGGVDLITNSLRSPSYLGLPVTGSLCRRVSTRISSPFSSPWGHLRLLDSPWDLQSPGGSKVLSGLLWVIFESIIPSHS